MMNRDRPASDDGAQISSPSLLKRRRAFEYDSGDGCISEQDDLPSYDDFTVAWICALHIELAAARAMLDKTYEGLPRHANDSNTYILGSIENHNIVIACLPAAQYGTNNAANVLTNLVRTFSSIELGLMVGIGGGVPSTSFDIRLGDVIVGTRVMQSDLGKMVGDGRIQHTAISRVPQNLLGTVVSTLRSKHELESSYIPSILRQKVDMKGLSEYARPTAPDQLFRSTYDHAFAAPDCDMCDHSKLVPRRKRTKDDPQIHYGAIASSNQVMRSGTARDDIARRLDVICFEMETAGLMDILPCLPIRGICDYSDSHKNKKWQKYAATTAAAYARELLSVVSATGTRVKPTSTLNPHKRVAYSSGSNLGSPRSDITMTHDPPNERRERLLESLKFDQIDARKLTIKPAHNKTCKWVLDHPDYHAWLDSSEVEKHHGFLWISGKPGAGKSTIMKFAYMNKKKTDRNQSSATAAFFFNARGEYLEKSVWGMYRSLLYQLLQQYPDLQSVFDDTELVEKDKDECPSLRILRELFHNAVSSLGSRSFTCFVDALDECDEQQALDMIEYFEDLTEQSQVSKSLKICFSSRHYPYITIRWGTRLVLEDLPGHLEDMEKYIQTRLRINDLSLMGELRSYLLEKAAGVFLWVVLVVEILNKEEKRGRLAMKKRLAEIPSGLSELFKDILKRDSENMEDLLISILWVLYSKRPLSPEEYYHAIWAALSTKGLADPEIPNVNMQGGSDHITKCVISSSKGLAEITKSKRQPTVQFIHESVRDFLLKDKGLHELWPELGFDWEYPGHDKLKKYCEVYLNDPLLQRDVQDLSSNREDLSRKYPFLEYASHYILYHADMAAVAISQHGFLSQFPVPYCITLLNKFEAYESRRYTPTADILYLLADKGFPNLIRTRLEEDPRIDIRGERYHYPLFAALANGNKEAVGALLGLTSSIYNGVDIAQGFKHKKDLKGYTGRTPLSWAVKEGRVDILELLIKKGADVEETDDESNKSLLRQAIESGNPATIATLLDAEWNSSTVPWTKPPLFRAMRMGEEAVCRILIEKGTDINTSDVLGDTPLHFAAFHGEEVFARLLIENGADLDARDRDNRTPLDNALLCGYLDVAKLFLENGVDLNDPDTNGDTRLHRLLKSHSMGSLHLGVGFLVHKGADINMPDSAHKTPLDIALGQGDMKSALLLFKNDANMSEPKLWMDTLLIYAVSLGDEDAVGILFEKGADVNVNKAHVHGNTPLHLASRDNMEAIAKLLIEQGADVNAGGYGGCSPLHRAAYNGHEAIARLLLMHGADVDRRNELGHTPHEAASASGHLRTVETIKFYSTWSSLGMTQR